MVSAEPRLPEARIVTPSFSRLLLRMASPARLYRAIRASREDAPANRDGAEGLGPVDPELRLYARILGTGHLHYGYFAETGLRGEEISLQDLREAQHAYAELLLDQLPAADRPVLDCGCGTGGFLELLSEHGYDAVGITPDAAQYDHVMRRHEDLDVERCRFEDLDTGRFAGHFGAVVCAESLQYLDLDRAFRVAGEILGPGGRWIVCDYFRTHRDAREGSGHVLEDFRAKVEEDRWSVVTERDITDHVLGTLAFAHALADQVGSPVVDFLVEKLRTKRPGLHELYRREIESLVESLDDKMAAIDPDQMRRDKTYRLFVLEPD